MEYLLNKLAIRMTPFQAYSRTHLLIVCIAVICAAGSAGLFALIAHEEEENVLSRRQKRSFTDVLLFVCGLLLLLMELMKQLLLTYVRGGSYSWSDFPFQLCSVPMYLCLIYPLFRDGSRRKNAIRQFLMTFGLIGAAAAFAVPYSSFYSYALLTAQSLIWHGILLFIALYLILSERRILKHRENIISRKKRRQRSTPLPVGAMSVYLISAVIALLLNLAFYHISQGTMNMFFFGPGYPDVFILNDIYDHCGWIAETAVMAAASETAAIAAWSIYRVGNSE